MSNKRKGENYYGTVEDRAVEGKSHRGEQGRGFPGCQTKPIEEGGKE
jgi:hypothetical protein